MFNTGGWVVETRDRDIAHGATVALVDEALDVVAVEMFRDGGEADRGSRVAVRCARDADLGTRTFRDEIARRITPDAPPWSTFCEAIGEETARRRALLRELIREGGV